MITKEESLRFVNDLVNGIDPKTGELIDEDSILNRSDIIRTLFAVKEYLEGVVEPKSHMPKQVKRSFELTNTDVIIEKEVAISHFVNRINEMNSFEDMKQAKYTKILNWLIEQEYLFINSDNKKEPTEKGIEIGISYKLKETKNGRLYYVTEYDSNAQRFILENIINGNIVFD